MAEEDLLNQLRDLEVAIFQLSVRPDAGRLEELLHDSFFEFGRSGQSYTKADILRELAFEQFSGEVWSQDFKVVEIADGIALLTYKSASLSMDGETSRHTLRSSLWQRTASGWQMRFHQGTPTGGFAKDKI